MDELGGAARARARRSCSTRSSSIRTCGACTSDATRLVQGARAAGAPICGVTVSAGIPEVGDAVALLDELADARHVAQRVQARDRRPDQARSWPSPRRRPTTPSTPTSKAAPRAATTPGRTSTTCSSATYHQLRSVPNVVVCVGGGIGDPARAGELLTGAWAARHGSIPCRSTASCSGRSPWPAHEATATPTVKPRWRRPAGTTASSRRGAVRRRDHLRPIGAQRRHPLPRQLRVALRRSCSIRWPATPMPSPSVATRSSRRCRRDREAVLRRRRGDDLRASS